MSTKSDASNNPSESQTPASNDGSEGGGPNASGPTPASEVSDTLQLTADLEKGYAGFDPAVHATGPDGLPVMRKGGGYARKRGRKAGTQAATGDDGGVANATQTTTETAQAAKPTRMSDKQASYMLTGMNSAVWTAIFGDEWRYPQTPEGKEEFTRHAAAVQEYLKATGGIDLSPAWGLAFAGLDYAAPRVSAPKTAGKLSSAWGWIKSKFGKGA